MKLIQLLLTFLILFSSSTVVNGQAGLVNETEGKMKICKRGDDTPCLPYGATWCCKRTYTNRYGILEETFTCDDYSTFDDQRLYY